MSNGHLQNWPVAPAFGPLGDGRLASVRSRPETVGELCAVVAENAGRGLAIYPQGGGTALDYGGPPARQGAAVETTALRRVIDYPHADMTITVEAGITAAELRSILLEKQQRLLVDIPQADRATLGGVYATGTCGPRRYGVGRPRDQIIGVSFVTAAGVEVKGGGRVVKNVAGYDFPKLLSGSLGTLGVITQMTLKVRPIPEASALVWVPLDGLKDAGEELVRLNTSDSRPIAIELMNVRAASSIGTRLDLPQGDWILVVGIEDNESSVRWQVNRLMVELGRSDLTVREQDEAASLWAELIELPATAPGPFDVSVSLPPSRLTTWLEQLGAGDWAVQAHAGNGIARLMALGEWSGERASGTIERWRAAVTGEGGSLVVTRCPSEWKATIPVWGPRRADWVVAEKVKRALDPGGVLNPGRFVGGI